MAMACAGCGCTAVDAAAHPIIEALRRDDLDAALQAGLLDADACPHCSDACQRTVEASRRRRMQALAARERYRARATRLQRIAAQQRSSRTTATLPAASAAMPAASGLPPAAAAALARALARAKPGS